MTLGQSINRSFNLLAVSIVGLAGFAFMAEIFLENEWADKADDIGLLVFGIVGIVWYLSNNKRFSRSVFPVVLVSLSLVTKIAALIVEFDDKEAVGDDFGALILFVLALGLISYQYWKAGKLLKEAGNNT